MTFRSSLACLAMLGLLAAAAGAQDQEPQKPETAQQLSTFAAQQLTKSIAELDQLREAVANEKLPMAEEITALEEQLAKARRDHDQLVRRRDLGNLEVANLEKDLKTRQDELGYVATLLDEYARAFESRLDVSELQVRGEVLEAAKAAAQNPALSPAEKFDRQVALVKSSVQRAFDALGGMTFAGAGVDMLGVVVNGTFALIGPVAIFADQAGVAGLVVAQAGAKNPLIRPLEGEAQVGLAAVVQQGEGALPVDPSRGGALKALIQRTNLIHVFEKGGPIMWPLLFCSVLALGVVLERLLFLANERRKRDRKALGQLFAALEKNDLAAAIGVGQSSRYFVVRALSYALAHREGSLSNALVYSTAQELKRFKRGIPVHDTCITLAPLLGLLGTVTGMMGSFAVIGGELSAPGAITGGIAEALIATAFGLGIAITALIPFNFLNARLDDATHELESAATQVELLVQPHASPAVLPPPSRTQHAELAV